MTRLTRCIHQVAPLLKRRFRWANNRTGLMCVKVRGRFLNFKVAPVREGRR